MIGTRKDYRPKKKKKLTGSVAIMQTSDNALGMRRTIRLERFSEDKVDNIQWMAGVEDQSMTSGLGRNIHISLKPSTEVPNGGYLDI